MKIDRWKPNTAQGKDRGAELINGTDALGSSARRGIDPWRGIRRGDRFYLAAWNAREGDQLWAEVTDLWFDPVKGQNNPKRGYMVAIDLMGLGRKQALTAATLAGKGYVRVDIAHARAEADSQWWADADG